MGMMRERGLPKIVFSDVDGTLVDADHHPMASSAPAFRLLAERGVPFCLVSARSPEGLYPIQRALGFSGPTVSYSGAYVLDGDGTELLSKPIALDEALRIKDYLDERLPKVCVFTYGFHTWIVNDRSDPRVAEEEYYVLAQARECRSLREAFDERGVHKFLLMGEPADIAEAQDIVRARFPELNAVLSRPELCEIMRGDVSKSDAVRLLCSHVGVDPKDALAFGDGANDLDMLEAVGQSYAMRNGIDEVRRAATHVTRWTNVEDGVARTLEEIFSPRVR